MAKKVTKKVVNKKASRPIAPDKNIKTQFSHEKSSGSMMSSRREMTKSPHRESKAEKGARKK